MALTEQIGRTTLISVPVNQIGGVGVAKLRDLRDLLEAVDHLPERTSVLVLPNELCIEVTE